MTTDKRAAAIAALIVRDVAEIPDRCSPDDQPEMMLVTSGELTDIVMRRLAALEADDGRALRDTALSITGAIGGTRREDWDDTVPVPTGKLFRLRDLLAAPEQPAPEPAAADAKPGDEVLRKVWDALRNTPHAAVSLEQQKWCIAVERVVCELVERALEVRP